MAGFQDDHVLRVSGPEAPRFLMGLLRLPPPRPVECWELARTVFAKSRVRLSILPSLFSSLHPSYPLALSLSRLSGLPVPLLLSLCCLRGKGYCPTKFLGL